MGCMGRPGGLSVVRTTGGPINLVGIAVPLTRNPSPFDRRAVFGQDRRRTSSIRRSSALTVGLLLG